MHFLCTNKLNFLMQLAYGERVVVFLVNKLSSKTPLALYRSIWGYILKVFTKSSQASAERAMRPYSFFIGTPLKTQLSN